MSKILDYKIKKICTKDEIKKKDIKQIYKIAFENLDPKRKNIDGLTKENIDDLTKVICKSHDSYIIYTFVNIVGQNLTKENIDDLTKAMCESCNSDVDFQNLNGFARYIPNLTKENINDLISALCNTDDLYDIYLFASNVENLTRENIDVLTKKICSLNQNKDNQLKKIARQKDSNYLYCFAISVENLSDENLNDLTKSICETKDAECIYKFAKNVINTEELRKALLDTDNCEYIFKYATYIDNSVIFEKYGTIENFYMQIGDSEGMTKKEKYEMQSDILNPKKLLYKKD